MSETTAPATAGDTPGARPAHDPPDLPDLATLPDDATIDVCPLAALLSCSTRHVWRMVDSGAMPQPLRLGRLRRWRVGDVREWVRRGCPPVRQRTGRARP
jgi:predicted DNA-binding transcriptional regulator AlpA